MTRARLVDAGFLLALATAALAGLAPTYTGWGFLLVGVLGLVVGVAVSWLTRHRGWPAIAAVVIGLVAFVLLGGPLCLRSEGASAYLPGPATVAALADQLVFGWKELLTTLPPVDGHGPLLVLPWAMGLATGLLGTLTAELRAGPALLRTALPLLAPMLLLCAVILLGVPRPHALWLQGAAFAGLGLGWLAMRSQRGPVRVRGGVAGPRRGVLGVAMVVVAGSLALPVGGWATGNDGRTVLRTYVEPPFDVGRYPSPLASFRRYVKPEKKDPNPANLFDEELLTVSGAPAGTRLRFAALDHYDGVVWGAANDTIPGSTSDVFQRVSSTIDNPVEGEELDVEVTLGEGYSGVWLPTVGALRRIEFGDSETAEVQRESFRYNLDTATGVVPAGLGPGDAYRITAVRQAQEVTANDAPSGLTTDAAQAASFLGTHAAKWAQNEKQPMARVFAIAKHLKRAGYYSDGVTGAEKIYHPGHGVKRLGEEFANAPIMAGNDEQYAAIMALLANYVGVPARVVFGAVVPESGTVLGKHVEAWVELQMADGSWRTLPTETFMSDKRPAKQPPIEERQMSGTVVPPPAPIPPPSTLAERNDSELDVRQAETEEEEDGGLPAWLKALAIWFGGPLLLALLVIGLILGVKALRRRRRRRAARASGRIVGGWLELVDHARDLGEQVPVGAGWTRREQAFRLPSMAAPRLARRADGHVFGPAEPGDPEAVEFWQAVDEERTEMSRRVTRRRRLVAAVNLTTFRRRSGRVGSD